MPGPVTLAELINAEADALTLAAVVNGPAGSFVTTRLGVTLPTLATALAGIANAAPADATQVEATISGAIDGNNKTFTRSVAGYSWWFKNGVKLRPGSDYIEVGTVATFTNAPQAATPANAETADYLECVVLTPGTTSTVLGAITATTPLSQITMVDKITNQDVVFTAQNGTLVGP